MKKTIILLFFTCLTIVGFSQTDSNEKSSTQTKLTAEEMAAGKKHVTTNVNAIYGTQAGEKKTESIKKLDRDISAIEKTISETTDIQKLNELNEKINTLKARREYLINKPKSTDK